MFCIFKAYVRSYIVFIFKCIKQVKLLLLHPELTYVNYYMSKVDQTIQGT